MLNGNSGYVGKIAQVDIVSGGLKTCNLIWNTTTLAWEAATGGSGAGNVNVTNFPSSYLLAAGNNLVGKIIPVNNAGTSYEEQFGNAIKIIDQEHAKVHDAKAYKISGKISGLANGASYNILFINPAGNYPHIRKYMITVTAAPCDIYIFEGTTVSANGTIIPVYNCRRSSANVSNLVAYHTPTITADGTAIEYELLTGTKQQGGTGDVISEEWIFKASTNYLLRITNNSGGATDAGFDIFFYEA